MVVHPYMGGNPPGGSVERVERGVTQRLRRLASDPFQRSILLATALVAGGFAAIGLAWRGAARSLVVGEQLSFLVSGGIGGLALVITGAAILAVQASRYFNARERRRLDRIVSRASDALGSPVTTRSEVTRRSRA
jgi:hypothetical protein